MLSIKTHIPHIVAFLCVEMFIATFVARIYFLETRDDLMCTKVLSKKLYKTSLGGTLASSCGLLEMVGHVKNFQMWSWPNSGAICNI